MPLLVSLAALGLAVWSAYETRTHDRLTVMPFVDFSLDLVGPASEKVGISLRNDGFGPAEIEETGVYLDGKAVGGWEPVQDVLRAFPGPHIDARWRWLPAKTPLRAGERRFLYTADSSAISEENRKPFNDLIQNRILVFVRACSIYQDCQVKCSSTSYEASGTCESQWRRLRNVAN
jgi:hypothetical protein